jgi:cytoskeletal protein RodZ
VLINTPIVTPTVSMSAVPASVKSGENIKIYWTSTNSNPGSCAISNETKGTTVASGQPIQMDQNSTPPALGYSMVMNDTGTSLIRVTCTNSTYGTSGFDQLSIQVDPLTKKIKVIER